MLECCTFEAFELCSESVGGCIVDVDHHGGLKFIEVGYDWIQWIAEGAIYVKESDWISAGVYSINT